MRILFVRKKNTFLMNFFVKKEKYNKSSDYNQKLNKTRGKFVKLNEIYIVSR